MCLYGWKWRGFLNGCSYVTLFKYYSHAFGNLEWGRHSAPAAEILESIWKHLNYLVPSAGSQGLKDALAEWVPRIILCHIPLSNDITLDIKCGKRNFVFSSMWAFPYIVQSLKCCLKFTGFNLCMLYILSCIARYLILEGDGKLFCVIYLHRMEIDWELCKKGVSISSTHFGYEGTPSVTFNPHEILIYYFKALLLMSVHWRDDQFTMFLLCSHSVGNLLAPFNLYSHNLLRQFLAICLRSVIDWRV